MTDPIAIVGLGCRYPDADGPRALWETVLAQRRAFRRLPAERLPLDEYGGAREDADVTYGTQAAVLTGWRFDRAAFRVAGSTYRTVDPSHWLALDCAARALEDAGFAGAEGLPRASVAVIVGNSLTGDYSRAAALRLRWPFVRRALAAALRAAPIDEAIAAAVIDDAEARYKRPLPPVGNDSLAGWLSNTIAGRICNHFDLGGGGYVVDGACSSSLLAVTTACDRLRAGAADVVLAGGVDLSLDPLELVGFAKTDALTAGEMRVYDRESSGFTPGEGCGFALLMRASDARARGCRVYAYIRGWGVSSDGHGGITRPEPEGQRRALARAYAMAGFGINTVSYFEGHGTGTPVGDAAEVAAITEERRRAGARTAAAIGSIKANIGHTKAAAGIAGFIKATLALDAGVIPPTTACPRPLPALDTEDAGLRAERDGSPWPEGPARAAVSAMGFGGINAHVVLEAEGERDARSVDEAMRACLRAPQDCELLPLSGDDRASLLDAVVALRRLAPMLSAAELTDAAVALQRRAPRGRVRAALVAATPGELEDRCAHLEAALRGGASNAGDGVFLGEPTGAPRITFLFPGQGAPSHEGGGAWRRRFAAVTALYPADAAEAERTDTLVAQPAIVRASLAALRMLDALGIEARLAIGHSLGELPALYWAGVFDEPTLHRVVASRARSMSAQGGRDGVMASAAADANTVARLIAGTGAVIAALNAPRQTVVSGPRSAVASAIAALQRDGIAVAPLKVSHAFHSPEMSEAARMFAGAIAAETLSAPVRRVLSTVSGRAIEASSSEAASLLVDQLTAPVQFDAALADALSSTDLFIEAGPGHILTDLVRARGAAAAALDACGPSLRGMLTGVASAYCLGASIDWRALTDGRFSRPFDFAVAPQVLVNPCEAERDAAPVLPRRTAPGAPRSVRAAAAPALAAPADTPLATARSIVAARAELPEASVAPEHRLLSDLHFNSITAAQVIVDICRALSLALPADPLIYADSSIGALLAALTTQGTERAGDSEAPPAGIAAWVRHFAVRWDEEARPRARRARRGPRVIAEAGDPLATALSEGDGEDGGATIVCLARRPDAAGAVALLDAARVHLQESRGVFVVVQRDGGGSAAARSVWLEATGRDVLVVNVDAAEDGHTDALAESIRDEIGAVSGFSEVLLRGGRRFVPRAVATRWREVSDTLGAGDVVLVTGGGKGITVECALALATRTRARLAILGRARPESDADLARNLARLDANGVAVSYLPCDVTDDAAVRAAVAHITGTVGPITAVLHAAAVNAPALVTELDRATIAGTVATKVDGLRHVLAAVDASALRLCIGFGSLTARTGMRGDSHYAAANELMALAIDDWSAAHPWCRGLTIEWSVWTGAGMGERLETLAALERQGIAPLTIDQGVTACAELVSSDARGRVIVAARFPHGATLRLAGGEPPLLRFLERPLAWFPGVELVTEAELTSATDLYLDDHVLDGERVLPAVFGLEAMAQAALAVAGDSGPVVEFDGITFDRPIVVPRNGPLRLRVAALARDGWIDVAVRSSETRFTADHFRGRCRFVSALPSMPPATRMAGTDAMPDAAALYGDLLFQRGRFARLRAYRELHATACVAALTPHAGPRWLASSLPGTLVLPDPGAHDAVLHAVQACVPESRLLPVGVASLRLRRDAQIREVRAEETRHDGRVYTYDLTAVDETGGVCGTWRGVRFSEVAGAAPRELTVPALVAPALERAAAAIAGARVAVAVSANPPQATSARAVAAARLSAMVGRRLDGRPELTGAGSPLLTLADDEEVTLAVTSGDAPVGCDLQTCTARPPEAWAALLDPDGWELARALAAARDESIDLAATRVWCAQECLRKAGLARRTPLLNAGSSVGWSLLDADGARVLTRAFTRTAGAPPAVVALLVGAAADARACRGIA